MTGRSLTRLALGAPLLAAVLALAATAHCAAGERAVVSPVDWTQTRRVCAERRGCS